MTVKELYELCSDYGCENANIRVMTFDDDNNVTLDCPLYESDVLCYDDEIVIQI